MCETLQTLDTKLYRHDDQVEKQLISIKKILCVKQKYQLSTSSSKSVTLNYLQKRLPDLIFRFSLWNSEQFVRVSTQACPKQSIHKSRYNP